ncbi:MAG: hypothetical protein E5W44_08345, partial [Mesorhizobium sp.]
EELGRALLRPDRGQFDEVHSFVNERSYEIRKTLYSKLKNKKSDDLIVVYFSGHGLLDENGSLYLSCSDSDTENVAGTSLDAADLLSRMRSCGAKKCAAMLDCCYSGAVFEWSKDDIASRGSAQLSAINKTYGTYVLASSTEIQTSKDGELSAFTEQIVRGLTSGEADRNSSGVITLTDLFDYSLSNLAPQNPRQFDIGGIGATPISASGKLKSRIDRLIEILQPRMRSGELSAEAYSLALSFFTQRDRLSESSASSLEKLTDELLHDRIETKIAIETLEILAREEQKRYFSLSHGAGAVEIVPGLAALPAERDAPVASRRSLNMVRTGAVASVGLTVLVSSVMNPRFLSILNLTVLAQIAAVSGILTLGSTIVMLIGRIDLSQGFLFTMATLVIALVAPFDSGMAFVAVVAALLLGAAVGLVNGAIVNRTAVSAVATLGVGFVLSAIIASFWIAQEVRIDNGITGLSVRISGVPIPFVVYVALIAVSLFLGNPLAAWATRTLNQNKLVVLCYVASGIATCLASVFLMSRLGSYYGAISGWNYVPSAIAGSIVGVYWFGGRWVMPGTMIAVAWKTMTANALLLMGAPVNLLADVVLLVVVVLITGKLWGPTVFEHAWQRR